MISEIALFSLSSTYVAWEMAMPLNFCEDRFFEELEHKLVISRKETH